MQRVGVAFPGDPSSPATWSGTPSGVLAGLEALGLEAVPVIAGPPPSVQRTVLAALSVRYLRPDSDLRGAVSRARAATRNSVDFQRLATWAAPRRLRQVGALDGIVQIGTGYELPDDVPVVTLEDMTVPQVRAHAYEGWDLFGDREYARRLELQASCYRRAVGVCLTSSWAARSVREDFGTPPAKVHIVGIGRNHEPDGVGSRSWATPRFLFVGLDWERKNGDAVLRAFAALRRQVPSARLDVVGGHPPLDQPGVTGHGVLALGNPRQAAEVGRLYAEATCFVMPSHIEACGITYAEAAAAGLPSIGTSCGGAADVIGDGGLTVRPDDDQGLLEAMLTLADPATAQRLGRAALRRSAQFTWPEVARRLLGALAGTPSLEVLVP